MAEAEQATEATKRSLEEETSEDGEKKQKLSISITQPKVGLAIKPIGLKKPITINLGGSSTSVQASKGPAVNKSQAATTRPSVFNADESESEEEMPPEARMRMRNVGKDTPTSAGPLSFSKTSKGFTDQSKLWQAKAQELAAKEGVELASVPKDNKDGKDSQKEAEA